MVAVIFALLGAALQVPLLAASIRQFFETNNLLEDPTFHGLDGGEFGAEGGGPPAGWVRLARVQRPTITMLCCTGAGIACGLVAAFAASIGTA